MVDLVVSSPIFLPHFSYQLTDLDYQVSFFGINVYFPYPILSIILLYLEILARFKIAVVRPKPGKTSIVERKVFIFRRVHDLHRKGNKDLFSGSQLIHISTQSITRIVIVDQLALRW